MATLLVFAYHPATGVQRIPSAWMDAYEASGFRLATVAEVLQWHAERGLPRPQRLPVAVREPVAASEPQATHESALQVPALAS